MTKFRPAVMTDNGQSLATQAEAGQIQLTFTKGVLSSDDLTQLGQTAVQQTTALDPFITTTINRSNIISANKIALPLSFSNEQMAQDNYAKTVGVYASDGTTEYLYAICINDAPLLISAYNGSTPEALEIEFRTEVGRASTVNVTVSPLDTVNREDFIPIAQKVNRFSINDSYNGGDMQSMPSGIYRLNNNVMTGGPYADGTAYTGTIINYGWYTTYVDHNGETFVTAPDSSGWQKYATQKSVDDGFEYHGMWTGSLAEFRHVASGVYQLDPSNQDAKGALQGWDGYGTAVVYHNGVDCYVTIYGHNNLIWNNHTVNDQFGGWVPQPTADDIKKLQSEIDNNFSSSLNINNSYSGGNDMYAMPPGIWKMNNGDMINTPYGDHTTIVGTIINYANYTTYVDKTGATYITAPDSSGWQQYATMESVSDGFEYHGEWDISLAEFRHAKSGVYQLNPSNQDAMGALQGWDGYGTAVVYHNGVDSYVTIYGHNNLIWINHTINDQFGAWIPQPTIDDINNIKSGLSVSFKKHDDYTGDLLNVTSLDDGYYNIANNQTNAPNGFDGYGKFVKQTAGTDIYIELYDNGNRHWTNHYGGNNWFGWTEVSSVKAVNTVSDQLNRFTINDSYSGTDMQSMPSGIYRLNNNVMTGGPYPAGTAYTGTIINYGWYTTYVDHTGESFVTAPDSSGWKKYGSKDDVDNLQTQINSVNSHSYTLNGVWNDNFNNLNNAKDGYWHIGGNYNGCPNGWSGWGIVIVTHNAGDCFVQAWDNANNMWRNHYGNGGWNGWKEM